MKAIILCFALIAIAAVNCETTADLLRAQNELSIAHEYAELQLQINRNIISSYIEIVQSQIIDSFMDSYEEIHFIQEDYTAVFDAFESTPCIEAVRARWALQVTRHGQRLSECLENSFFEISGWNDFVNNIHHTAQATTNQVQNAGVSELSDTDNFTRRQSLYTPINRRLRNLLTAARPYLERFEEFRASVVDNEEEIIRELTQCDRSLAASFNNEARDDVERANQCLAAQKTQ